MLLLLTANALAVANPSRDLMNIWHIPVNGEPAPATMRSPVNVHTGVPEVAFYLGGYPMGQISAAQLKYRVNGGEWNTQALAFYANQNNNEYYSCTVANTFSSGDEFDYYFSATSPGFTPTFVYGTDETTNTTGEETAAQEAPYTFYITDIPTPTPMPTPGLMNIWHIPINNEPSGTTMRNPVYVTETAESVSFHIGGWPQGAIGGASLYHRLAGAAEWTETLMSFQIFEGDNEYFSGTVPNSYQIGDQIQYYLGADGEQFQRTFLYGSDSTSFRTNDEEQARTLCYSFFVMRAGTPTATPTPGSETPTPSNLMNIWHIPANEEPPSVTMRNPLWPGDWDESVYFYLGGWPMGTIWYANIFYRIQGEPSWLSVPMVWDSNQDPNEYFTAFIPMIWTAGTTVEYFFEGENPSFETTYVYNDSQKTGDIEVAQLWPYSFTVRNELTPTPSPTPTQGPSPTPINVWHIPANVEPTATMRDPLYPEPGNVTINLYLGGYPQGSLYSASAAFQLNGGGWQTAQLLFFSNSGTNEYWNVQFQLPLALGDRVEYYFAAAQFGGADTYVYGDDNSSNTTLDQQTAVAAPFVLIVGHQPTPTPESTVTWTPTFSPTPSGSPTATQTPTVGPTFTPTPTVAPLGVELHLSKETGCYRAGDSFEFWAMLNNPGSSRTVDFYVLLEVLGEYWFYDSWTQDVDYVSRNLPASRSVRENIMSFTWPSGAGSLSGVRFYGAMFTPGTYDFVGAYDMIEWCFQ